MELIDVCYLIFNVSILAMALSMKAMTPSNEMQNKIIQKHTKGQKPVWLIFLLLKNNEYQVCSCRGTLTVWVPLLMYTDYISVQL